MNSRDHLEQALAFHEAAQKQIRNGSIGHPHDKHAATHFNLAYHTAQVEIAEALDDIAKSLRILANQKDQ